MNKMTYFNLKKPSQLMSLMVALVVAVSSLQFFMQQQASAAGSANLYLSPASGSVQINNNITVGIYAAINGASAVTVESHLLYDSTKLQLASIDTSGTSFEIVAQKTSTNSDINIVVATSTPVTGTQLVAKVTFKALVGSGNTSVTFNQASSAVFESTEANNILTSVVSATYSFTSASVTPPASSPPSSTKPGSSTAKKPVTVAPSAPSSNSTAPQNTTSSDIKAPELKEPVSMLLGYNTATATLTSDEPVKLIINYGTTRALGLTVSTADYSLTPELSLDSSNLTAGTTYYYEAQVIDAGGNMTISDIATFKTKGYQVKVALRDSSQVALSNLMVELNSETQTGVTDDEGVVMFYDVAPGTHTVSTMIGKKPYMQTIEVVDTLGTSSSAVGADISATEQNFDLTTSAAANASSTGLLIVGGVALILTVTGVIVLLLNKRRGKGNGSGGVGSATSPSLMVHPNGNHAATGSPIDINRYR